MGIVVFINEKFPDKPSGVVLFPSPMGILVFIKLLRHGEKVYSDEWFPSPMGILVFINETAKWSLEHGYKFPSPMGILVFINPTLETLAMQGLKQQFASQT